MHKDFLEILVELQLLLIEYCMLLARFSFELFGDAKRNTSNRLINNTLKLSSDNKMMSIDGNRSITPQPFTGCC